MVTFQIRDIVAYIIVVVRFAMSISTVSGLHPVITLYVRISKSHSTFTSLFSATGSG